MSDLIGRYQPKTLRRIEPVGRIVEALLPELNRDVYIRELCPPPTLTLPDRERLLHAFESEAALLGRVADPRVARPSDVGWTLTGTLFLAYDPPEREGYGPLPQEPGALNAEAWAQLAAEVCRAAAALADAGVLLHEVDPEFIFLSAQGGLRLLPLGMGHLPLHLGLPAGLVAGSPYAAPEVARGAAPGAPALCFSIAAWLYTMLAGRGRPSPASLVAAGVQPEPLWTINGAVPVALDDAIRAALSPDPTSRPADLRSFAGALQSSMRSTRGLPIVPPKAEVSGPVTPAGEQPSPALQFLAWAVGLGVAGSLCGWVLGQLFPPR
jgi:serine/threonine protein kinase